MLLELNPNCLDALSAGASPDAGLVAMFGGSDNGSSSSVALANSSFCSTVSSFFFPNTSDHPPLGATAPHERWHAHTIIVAHGHPGRHENVRTIGAVIAGYITPSFSCRSFSNWVTQTWCAAVSLPATRTHSTYSL